MTTDFKKALVLQVFNKDEFPINLTNNDYQEDEKGRKCFWFKKDDGISYKFLDMGFDDKWICTMAINNRVLGT